MVETKIEELEYRYQKLVNDFQAGNINEARFVSEVDQLQFQDDWGRYWMLGSQSGTWHYYDGQAWHQADPHDREKLSFMDNEGRYWQKGAKSGDWYYYQADTGEWVKPSEDDPRAPSSFQEEHFQEEQWQTPTGPSQPDYGYEQPQDYADTGAGNQFDAQLFQDDEGRYWTIGAKTGQWYFYDENGWHPAHEFQAGGAPQPQAYQTEPDYSPPPQQPQAPYYQQPYQSAPAQAQPPRAHPPTQPQQPAQGYSSPPAQTGTSQQEPQTQPAPPQPAAEPAFTTEPPAPPQGAPQSGTWYYHDGKQWLKYSTGEPAEENPPDPSVILEQEADVSRPKKATSDEESIVAEFFEEDEPPVEVVDVEVITVVDAEPEEEAEEPEPAPKPTPKAKRASESTEEVAAAEVPPRIDDYIPRRNRPPTEELPKEKSPAKPEKEAEGEAEETSEKRTPPETAQPVRPRKRQTPHEPTIIIPTGSTASGISSPSTTRARMPTKPVRPEPRRARDDTLPMEPVPLTGRPTSGPTSDTGRHRQVTQQLPTITNPPTARSDTSQQLRVAKRARQSTPEQAVSTAASAGQSAVSPQQAEPGEKKGYSFGDVLRSLPSTIWTLAIGVVVLTIFAFVFIGFSIFSGGFFGPSVVAVQSPTPTLDPGIAPDSTPTPGPTPTDTGPVATPTAVSMAIFSNPVLDFTLEYPENWQTEESAQQAIFSPSAEGLDPNAFNDTGMRIGMSTEENAISDLLATVLSIFPDDAETLNDGTISIASQTWTSTQIRFEEEDLGGEGIATVAVTSKDNTGYFLVAVASASEWNSVQPVFQEMINSFRFGAETVVAQQPAASTASSTDSSAGGAGQANTDSATPTPQPVPTLEAELKPVIHVIQSGDTLLGIANQYGVDADLLASENSITDPTGLRIGQELTIPFTAEQLAEYYASGGTSAASSSSDTSGEGSTAPAEQSSADSSLSASETEEASETAAAAPAEPTSEPTEEAPPAAALSGRIAYPAFNPGSNTYDIWIVDVASGEQTPFMGNASQPAFNKDGSLLAYRSWDLGTRGIFFKDFVGGRGGIVTRFVEDGMPTWAPDGFTFAFSSRKEGDRVPRVYIGNQLGEDPIGLGFQGEYPSTMPDGRLVVKGCTPSGDCGIFVMGPRGGGETKLSDDPSDTAPAPAPDGNKIAFMSNTRGGANNWEIWIMPAPGAQAQVNADGSSPKRLTENNNNDGLPSWSPDGQSIAFVSDRGGAWAIWVMNADGSNQRKLIDMKGSPNGVVLHDEPNSKGWLEERISWAP